MTKSPTKQTQTDLETLFNKNQLLPVLRGEFTEFLEGNVAEDQLGVFVEALVQIYLHRQCDPETMVGILSPKFGEPQEVADILLLMCEFDFIDYDTNLKRFKVKYDISEDVQEMLSRYQYPLPMVTPPKTLKSNTDTGYETIKGSVILNGSKHFNKTDNCLDHLNRVNSVSLCLDMSVIKSAEGKMITPSRNQGEDFTDFRKRMKQASVFYDTSVNVMETIDSLSDELFMTHKYDRRGRTYASGYHVNTQGTDYNKAVLQLSNKELVT